MVNDQKQTDFERGRARVNRMLRIVYGIDLIDAGWNEEKLINSFKLGESPKQFITWITEKYDLQTKKEFMSFYA